jgi:hypothetical protein
LVSIIPNACFISLGSLFYLNGSMFLALVYLNNSISFALCKPHAFASSVSM